jgi:hypothetical protein
MPPPCRDYAIVFATPYSADYRYYRLLPLFAGGIFSCSFSMIVAIIELTPLRHFAFFAIFHCDSQPYFSCRAELSRRHCQLSRHYASH